MSTKVQGTKVNREFCVFARLLYDSCILGHLRWNWVRTDPETQEPGFVSPSIPWCFTATATQHFLEMGKNPIKGFFFFLQSCKFTKQHCSQETKSLPGELSRLYTSKTLPAPGITWARQPYCVTDTLSGSSSCYDHRRCPWRCFPVSIGWNAFYFEVSSTEKSG